MSAPNVTPTPSDRSGKRPDAASARGAVYALIAAAWRYPDETLALCLGENGPPSATMHPLDSIDPAFAAALREWLEFARGRFSPDQVGALASEYAGWSGHAVRGDCPPYELEYGNREIVQQASELADIAGFYAAFGLQPANDCKERPDHLSMECEFMAVLCAKESFAEQNGDELNAETCFDAQRAFLRDHLGRWVFAFANRFLRRPPDSFYGRLAALTRRWAELECERMELPVGAQWLELAPADPARDAAVDCGPRSVDAPAASPLVQLTVGT